MPEENQNQSQSQSQEASIVNTDGTFIKDWANKYPEADRATLSRFTKFDDLVTSHMSQRKMLGKNPDALIELPTETSSDEVKAAFHKARGVPDEAKDYKYERNSDLPDSIDTSDEKVAAFAQIARGIEEPLSNKQFNEVVNGYLALIGKDITAFDIAEGERSEQSREAGVALLKKFFGSSLEERTLRAEALMRKYGDRVIKDANGNEVNILEELYNELPGIENSSYIRLLLDNVASDMSEDRLKGLSGITTKTPSGIQDEINELRALPAYMDETDPLHKSIQAKITALYQKKSA